jgi:excisionase family DNA binding protein
MSVDVQNDYISVSEAARILQVSASTIWRWIERGELLAYRIGPRRVRLRRGELGRVVTPSKPVERRWTEEELQKAREAYEGLQRIWAEERARGIVWPNSAEDIRNMREERAEQIDPLH